MNKMFHFWILCREKVDINDLKLEYFVSKRYSIYSYEDYMGEKLYLVSWFWWLLWDYDWPRYTRSFENALNYAKYCENHMKNYDFETTLRFVREK